MTGNQYNKTKLFFSFSNEKFYNNLRSKKYFIFTTIILTVVTAQYLNQIGTSNEWKVGAEEAFDIVIFLRGIMLCLIIPESFMMKI